MKYCTCKKPEIDGDAEDGYWCNKCQKTIEQSDYEPEYDGQDEATEAYNDHVLEVANDVMNEQKRGDEDI